MDELTVITKQVYHLNGNEKTNGTYKVGLIDTLDENNHQCLCREIIDGEKHFSIIVKNINDEICGQEVADMIEPSNNVTGVSYLKSNDEREMFFIRYLVGDHTDEVALSAFFKDVEKRIKKTMMFRGWMIDDAGVLTTKKAEYFY